MNDNKSKETEQIAHKCIILLNFIKSQGNIPFIEEAEKGIQNAIIKRNLRGLKIALKDLSDWASDFKGGDEILKIINEVKHDVLNEISRILDSGEISNAEEYRVLLNFVDEHFDDPKYDNLVAKINAVLENPSDWIKGDLSED